MKFLVNLLIALSILACSEEGASKFLKRQQIPLAQPRIQTTSQIIDSSVIVTAGLRLKGAEIFYTNDGSEPTKEALKYEEKLTLDRGATYCFKAFHSDWKASETTKLKLYEKGHVPTKLNWDTPANRIYPGFGESTIINQQKGALNFRSQEWLGFDSIAVATVTFEDNTFIQSIIVGYLVDTKSWIFPPSQIKLYLDQDTLQVDLPKIKKTNLVAMEDIEIPVGKELTSIKVEVNNLKELPEWHPGKGNKAWLFMDEWIFN